MTKQEIIDLLARLGRENEIVKKRLALAEKRLAHWEYHREQSDESPVGCYYCNKEHLYGTERMYDV